MGPIAFGIEDRADVTAGWVPDTIPSLSSHAAGQGRDGVRPALTAISTPPRRGGVRRSGRRTGDASPVIAWLGSCR